MKQYALSNDTIEPPIHKKSAIREYGWYLVKRVTALRDFAIVNGIRVDYDTYTRYEEYLLVEWCEHPHGSNSDYWHYNYDHDCYCAPDKYFEVIRKIEGMPDGAGEPISKEEFEAIRKATVES